MTPDPLPHHQPYAEYAPPGSLRDYVVCIWRSHSPDQPRQTTILPDGCIDLIWQPGNEPFVSGPMTQPVAMQEAAGSSAMGIRFQPGVAATVLGVSAADLRDIQVPLADLFPAVRRDTSLARAIAGVETLSVTYALETTSKLLRQSQGPDPFIADATRWFAHNPGRPEALFISASGVSERHARRRFHDHVGYGPKTLQRILRMQRVLWLLSRPGPRPSLAQLAIASGYADQAHLTRELRVLTGHLPTALAGNNPRSAVADLFKTALP